MSRLRKWTSDDCRAVVLIEALQLDFDCTSLLRPLRRSHAWALCITTKGLRFLLRGCRKAAWPWFWLCINYKSPVQFSDNSSAGTWEPCYLDTQSPWLLHRGLRSEACRKVCTYSFFFFYTLDCSSTCTSCIWIISWTTGLTYAGIENRDRKQIVRQHVTFFHLLQKARVTLPLSLPMSQYHTAAVG